MRVGADACSGGGWSESARPGQVRESGRRGAYPHARIGADACCGGGSSESARPEQVRESGAAGNRALRLFTAQFRWLCTPAPLALALGLVALPLGLAWLARAQVLTGQQLQTGLLHVAERYLPLWALVAAGAVWSDAEPEHRPLLFAWGVRSWALALAKLAAADLAYTLLAGAAALALPALLAGADAAALPRGLLFIRALLPGLVLLALASTGSAPGGPWAGMGLGAGLWFVNLLDPVALWLDRATAGALHLFTLTRGSVATLGQANQRQALAAMLLLTLVLLAPAATRRAAQRRFL